MARASNAVSSAGRTKTTLVAGREVRRLSQTVIPSPNEMVGPNTTTYSSGCWASHGSRRSVVSTDWQPGGRAPSNRRAVVLSGSTMTGMVSSLGEEGLERGAGGTRGDGAVLREQSESQVERLRREDHLLGLLLGAGQCQQRTRKLLGRLCGAVLRRGGGGRGRLRRADVEDRHLGQQKPSRLACVA